MNKHHHKQHKQYRTTRRSKHHSTSVLGGTQCRTSAVRKERQHAAQQTVAMLPPVAVMSAAPAARGRWISHISVVCIVTLAMVASLWFLSVTPANTPLLAPRHIVMNRRL